MRLEEIIPDKDDPFKDCKLGRKKQAEALKSLITSFDRGGVIALNNRWGAGKTTFIRMFDQHIRNEGYTTIYFNAWENDFDDNPLSALIGELSQHLTQNKHADEVIEHGAKLFLDVSSAFVGHLIEKHIGSAASKTIFEAINNSSAEIFKEELKEYAAKKESLNKFHQSLTEFVAENTKKSPLVFFVDELDRCNPDYAVRLLECVKHLFSVPNILFILSVDKTQLEHSVNGFYGSDKFDSNEYLRRFIDVEYSLPKPELEKYIEHLFVRLGFSEFISKKYGRDASALLHSCKLFYDKMTLRQIERAMTHLCLILKSEKINANFFYLLQFLIYTKHDSRMFYYKIVNRQLSISDLSDGIVAIYKSNFGLEGNENLFGTIEAEMVYTYDKLLNPRGTNSEILDYKSNEILYTSTIDDSICKEMLKSLNSYDGRDYHLGPLLDHIELIV